MLTFLEAKNERKNSKNCFAGPLCDRRCIRACGHGYTFTGSDLWWFAFCFFNKQTIQSIETTDSQRG